MPVRRWACGFVTIALATTAWAWGVDVQGAPATRGAAMSPPPVLVSQVTTDPDVASGEAWVVTDPRDPQEVAVVWLATRDATDPTKLANGSGYCGMARSSDGGRTWSSTKQLPFRLTTAGGPISDVQSNTGTVPICGDPVAGVGPDGTLYAAAAMVGSPSWTQGITSVDHGWSWTEPKEIFGVDQLAAAAIGNPGHKTPAIGMGRAYMAVDPVTGEISVHSQEDAGVEGRFISVSSDHGATWSTPRPLDPDIQSSSAGAHSAAGGTIAVAYVVDPSSATYRASPSPAVTCAATCTVFETTADHGATWSRHVMPVQGVPGSKIVAADPSHPGRFAVLLTTNSGRNIEVWVTDDIGNNWTRTNVLTAAAGESLIKPWVAYSPNGTLGAVWRTQYPDGSTNVSAITSRDGGTSFSEVVPLTTTRVPPDTGVGPGDDCACNVHLDATTLSATWANRRSGQRQIYFGRFDYTTLAQ